MYLISLHKYGQSLSQTHLYCNLLLLLLAQVQLIQMVVWMLQRRLLIQLHTYVCLLVPPSEDEPGIRDEEPLLAARVGGRSLSTPSALSFGSPSMSCSLAFCSYGCIG